MTERLVFASHRAPVVLDSGAPIRTYKLLSGLAKEFETTLVTFSDDPASPDGFWHQEELSGYFTDTTVVAVSGAIATTGQAKRRAQLASLTSAQSWVFGRT